jgi:hypothetical protein
VADFVPESHPTRQWADTFPWAALVDAIAFVSNGCRNEPNNSAVCCY